MWLFHETLKMVTFGTMLIAIPPMLLFRSRRWADRIATFCIVGLLACFAVFGVTTYGTHWNFSGWLIAPAGKYYADGCLRVDPQRWLDWATKGGWLLDTCVVVMLLLPVSLGCFWYDARLQHRQEGRGHV
jgi:hypothetical protein